MLRRIIGAVEQLTSSTVGLIVFSLAVGIVIAMVFILIQQYAVGGFVRKLRARGAVSAQTAVTAAELGVRRNIFVLGALKMSESALRRVVFASELSADVLPEADTAEKVGNGSDKAAGHKPRKKEKAKKERIKVREAHWYIPEDKTVKADALFGKERVSPVLLVIAIAILLVLMYFLIPFIPNLIEFAEALLAA